MCKFFLRESVAHYTPHNALHTIHYTPYITRNITKGSTVDVQLVRLMVSSLNFSP
jgi:hypothetical protein